MAIDTTIETAKQKLERRILNGQRRSRYRDGDKAARAAQEAQPAPERIITIKEGSVRATRGERMALRLIRGLIREDVQRTQRARELAMAVEVGRLQRLKRGLLLEKLRRLAAAQRERMARGL